MRIDAVSAEANNGFLYDLEMKMANAAIESEQNEIVGSLGAKKSLSKKISELMLKNISEKIWMSGDKIPTEKELMKLYSVSRITIREAIRELVSMGLLKTIQGSGSYVCEYNPEIFKTSLAGATLLVPTTKQDVLKILELRKFEVIVAGQAAELSTDIGVAKLEAVHQLIVMQPISIEVQSFADVEFHMQICKMTNNPFIVQVCQTIYDALRDVMPVIKKIMGSDLALYYHEKLIDTIKKHYVVEAKVTMEEHLHTTIEAVQSISDDSEIFVNFGFKHLP